MSWLGWPCNAKLHSFSRSASEKVKGGGWSIPGVLGADGAAHTRDNGPRRGDEGVEIG